jgi:AcrR family transcriptional regulator
MILAGENLFSRDRLREQKREALVKQAALEFRRRGYHATSMDDIAGALGVTKGALYRYVKSKDEVLFECFMHSNRIGEAALARVKRMNASGAEKLNSFIVEFIREYLDSNLAGGAMVEIDALLPAQRKKVVQGRDGVGAQLRALLEAGIADGSVSNESPKLMLFSFMGAINWIPSWFSPEGALSSQEIAEQIARIVMNGVRSRAR